MLTVEFLRAILPNDGYKCWVSIKEKIAINHFCTDFEELADAIQQNNALGIDTYHACSSFLTPDSRKAVNVLGTKSFFMDIDVGEGKPYATVEDAISACDEFCDRCALPFPGLLRSGGGVHAYWPLNTVLNPHTWMPLAQRLKLLANLHGFHADPTRTADISSILRPHGTHNYKLSGSPRPVIIDDASYFVEHDALTLGTAIIEAPSPPSVHSTAVTINPPSVNAPKALNSALTAGLAKQYDFTVGMKEGEAEGRNTRLYHMLASLMARNVPTEEAVRQCAAWNQLNQPPLPDKEFITTVRSMLQKHATNHPAPPPPDAQPAAQGNAPTDLPGLPFGFSWGADGKLLLRLALDDDQYEYKPVTNWPVFLQAILQDEHTGKNACLFRQYTKVKGWHDVVLTADEFHGRSMYARYFEKGGSILANMDKHFMTCMRGIENMLRYNNTNTMQYSQFGWKEDNKAFLVGDYLCKDDGTVERAYGSPKLAAMMPKYAPSFKGSLQQWTILADSLFSPGMEGLNMMMLAAAAAPLMQFCVDEGNGGAILSFMSEESGVGKTAMLTAVASFWGALEATVYSGNLTGNRRTEELVRRNNLPFAIDEPNHGDPLYAAEEIAKFTGGSNRARVDRSGNVTDIPEHYRTIMMLISNKSLLDTVRPVNPQMSRRVMEIELNRPMDVISNLGYITQQMMSNCGHVGLQFARIIVQPQVCQWIEQELKSVGAQPGRTVQHYRALLKSEAEHRYIIWSIAAVDVAARILVNYGLLHFDVERIMSYVVDQARLQMHPEVGGDTSYAGKLALFIQDHLENTLTVPDAFKHQDVMARREPKGRCLLRYELKTGLLYIDQETIGEWCVEKRISYKNMAKELEKREILVNRSKQITLGAGTPIPSGRRLCWCVNMKHKALADSEAVEDMSTGNLKLVK